VLDEQVEGVSVVSTETAAILSDMKPGFDEMTFEYRDAFGGAGTGESLPKNGLCFHSLTR
jgi:hypothetical protein